MSSPLASPILRLLQDIHRRVAGVREGELASYIPELTRANPEWFGICVATATGGLYEVGDTAQPFTIQSISKPLVYGIALEDHGRTEVLRKIGVEPSGEAFNSISLEAGTGRPRNPMINAGAIVAAGLVLGHTPEGRFERVRSTLSLYAGRELGVDEAVYASESATGFRNRAIGYLLRNCGILEGDPTPALELYFRQCAIAVTCRDLALMGATLANRGRHPLTGKQAVRGEYVESILSVMGSCGMYDYAGEWIYRVGMPAKSGVGGGLLAVLPGQLAIAVFSPRLDARGNSARGILVCNELSRRLDLHLFNHPPASRSVIRAVFTAAEVGSRRLRPAAESRCLRTHGASARTYQLQGHLTFTRMETVVADILRAAAQLRFVILDLRRVLDMHEGACLLLADLVAHLPAGGPALVLTHAEALSQLRRILRVKLGEEPEARYRFFADNDAAWEWAEDHLLAALLPGQVHQVPLQPQDYDILEGLNLEEVEQVVRCLRRRSYAEGEVILEAGAPAESLFVLVSGRVSARVETAEGGWRRVAALSPGMAFGEMALVERAARSATVVADTPATCDEFLLADLESIGAAHPRIRLRLLENIARGLSRRLRQSNRERAALED